MSHRYYVKHGRTQVEQTEQLPSIKPRCSRDFRYHPHVLCFRRCLRIFEVVSSKFRHIQDEKMKEFPKIGDIVEKNEQN